MNDFDKWAPLDIEDWIAKQDEISYSTYEHRHDGVEF